jgi:hypothetical protein
MLDDNSKTWLVDVNGDGKADLVTQGGPGSSAAGWVAVGISSGLSFPQWSWTSGQRMLDDASNTWFVDMNGDQKADLVTRSLEPGRFPNMFTGLSSGLSFAWWTYSWSR